MEDQLVDTIHQYISIHEVIVTNKSEDAYFTSFGSRATFAAIREILKTLDKDSLDKVIEMMTNKKCKTI